MDKWWVTGLYLVLFKDIFDWNTFYWFLNLCIPDNQGWIKPPRNTYFLPTKILMIWVYIGKIIANVVMSLLQLFTTLHILSIIHPYISFIITACNLLIHLRIFNSIYIIKMLLLALFIYLLYENLWLPQIKWIKSLIWAYKYYWLKIRCRVTHLMW